MTRKEHFTLRLNPDTLRRLGRQAIRVGQPRAGLAERYLEEGVRMTEHPGIVFREGPSGRRAGLVGHALDVWEVVETIQQEEGDIQAAAAYLAVSPHLVAAAQGYYADYPDEIDAWIASNTVAADDSEASLRRRVDSFGR